MKPEYQKLLLLTAFYITFTGVVSAQSKDVGMEFSISGISVSYEYYVDSESFIDINLKAECADVFFGRSDFPGASASITWNIIFAESKSCNGNDIRMFAGPGLMMGWGNDLMRPAGLIVGLKGRVGAECEFNRNVTISVSLSPVIGTHMMIFEDYVEMRYYRSGLIASVLPIIGVKYIF